MANSDNTSVLDRLVRAIESPVFRIVVPLLIVAIALFVLHKLAAEAHWSDIKADIANSSWETLITAVFWTSVSFVALSFYDILAVRSVAKGVIPSWVAGLAGSSGFRPARGGLPVS